MNISHSTHTDSRSVLPCHSEMCILVLLDVFASLGMFTLLWWISMMQQEDMGSIMFLVSFPGQLCHPSVHVCYDPTHLPNPSLCVCWQSPGCHRPVPDVWVSASHDTLIVDCTGNLCNVIALFTLCERILHRDKFFLNIHLLINLPNMQINLCYYTRFVDSYIYMIFWYIISTTWHRDTYTATQYVVIYISMTCRFIHIGLSQDVPVNMLI